MLQLKLKPESRMWQKFVTFVLESLPLLNHLASSCVKHIGVLCIAHVPSILQSLFYHTTWWLMLFKVFLEFSKMRTVLTWLRLAVWGKMWDPKIAWFLLSLLSLKARLTRNPLYIGQCAHEYSISASCQANSPVSQTDLSVGAPLKGSKTFFFLTRTRLNTLSSSTLTAWNQKC